MSGTDQKVLMAWALGYVSNWNGKDNFVKVKLGEINPEWKGYELVHCVRSEKKNDWCGLWYNGKFGVEDGNIPIMDVYSGFNMDHVIHMLIQAINCHQAELRA